LRFVRVLSTTCNFASIISIVSKCRPFSLPLIGETEKSRVGAGWQSYYFWSKIPLQNRKCEMVCCRDATASSFVATVWDEIFAHFRAVTVKQHSSMWNYPFGLPGQILCEQSSWCQRKRWACSRLCSSPFSPFSVSVSLDFPCTTHTFFLERLFNHCPGLCCTFSKICTNFDAVPL
jgi:hypothetical protein